MQKRVLLTLLVSSLILTLSLGLTGTAAPRPLSTTGKGNQERMAQQPREETFTFLVQLAEQADLSPAHRIRDWDRRGRFVLDALQGVARRTQPPVLSALESLKTAGHVSAVRPHYILNLLLVQGDREAAVAIARLPQVAAVYPAPSIIPVTPVETAPVVQDPQAVEWNVQMIRADQVWSTYGITGTGIVAANIDSGVEYTHPALVRQYRGNLGGGSFEHDYNWWDPTDQYDYPAPISGPYPLGSGHGTHTMGVIVGDDGGVNQIGVAPGAQWVAAYGFSGIDGLLSAVEWMIAPWQVNDFDPDHPTADPSKRPHVVNNSWGAPGGFLLANDLLEVWRAAGIFPAFAAGNNGYPHGCGTLISPGDNPAAFGVGATDSGDNIAFFSSRGPNALEGWLDLYGIGPQVSAPGYGIRSSDPGGDYGVGGGTSYASPHVAGTVALLWEAEPDLMGRVEETAELIRRTAVPRTTAEECGGVPGSQVPNNTYGWGRIDALAAVEMIWQAGTLTGTVTDVGTGAPIPSARILATRSGYTLTTPASPSGGYRLLLGQGTYTVTVEAYGYAPQTQTGVSITQDLTTTLDLALPPRPTYLLSGLVTAEGEPVAAQVGVESTPFLTSTDPVNGVYSGTLAEGSYPMRVTARGYAPQSRPITVTGDLTETFSLSPGWTYYVRDSRSPCGPTFDWIDATDGTPHALSFQDYAEIYEPGLPFPFYETPYVHYYVSSNGFISFGQGYPQHGQDLPQMVIPFEGPANNAIYGFEEMLNPAYGGQGMIYHKVVDDHTLVVEFHQVEHWPSGSPETFEFILDTETGVILLQYLEVSYPDWVTVGVENQDGSDGVLYAYAGADLITDTLAVGFYPIFGPPPADQKPGGVMGTLSGTVVISGTNVPVPEAVVTATSFLRTLTTTADMDGRYLFPDICADLYHLQAGAPGYDPSPPVRARLRWADDLLLNDLPLTPHPPTLHLTKTVAMTQVQPGEYVTYSLAYANKGAGLLSGVTLSDTLPTAVVYITSTPSGVYRGGSLTWRMDLAAGAGGEIAIVGMLTPTVAPTATVTNIAWISWLGWTLSSTVPFDVYQPPERNAWLYIPIICRDMEG